MGKHRKFSAELKAKIAVEALKGQRTVQEIASSYSVHPNQVTNWRKQLVDFSAEAFSTGRLRSDQLDEQLKTDLYSEIGRLKVELDWLQKKSGLSRWASSKFSRRTPIVFLGDQFSMPRQQCFWCNDGRHHRQQFATELLRFRGQSTPLIITKPQHLHPA